MVQCPVKMSVSVAVLFTTVVFIFGLQLSRGDELNNRPIIGVLAQESADQTYGNSYMLSSYVRYLESAGARVVPVRIYEKDQYYEDLFSHINGILLPGGGVNLTSSGYAKAAQTLYKLALQANDKGDYFPVWGTCLGFEMLTVLTSGENLLAPNSDSEDYIVPLNLTKAAGSSRMLKDIPKDVLTTLTTWNVTANFHQYCLTPTNFSRNGNLNKFYRVISTNYDRKGREFISTMEAYRYPIYGTQWHPETNLFRWDLTKHCNHSAGAVKVAQFFANFLVNEARKSGHHYPAPEVEAAAIMDNYHPVYLGAPSFRSSYYFNYTDSQTDHTEHPTYPHSWYSWLLSILSIFSN